MRLHAKLFFALLAMTLLSGCGRSRDDKAAARVSFGDSAIGESQLGPNDVQITSSDGSIVMAVVGDTVRMQLSDSLRNDVAQQMDTAAKSNGGFGAAIAKSVGEVVSSAMGFVVRIPVEDIQHLRYENGRLRFDVRGGKIKLNTSDNSSGGNAMFDADDAKRFIDAVERRQRRKGVAM